MLPSSPPNVQSHPHLVPSCLAEKGNEKPIQHFLGMFWGFFSTFQSLCSVNTAARRGNAGPHKSDLHASGQRRGKTYVNGCRPPPPRAIGLCQVCSSPSTKPALKPGSPFFIPPATSCPVATSKGEWLGTLPRLTPNPSQPLRVTFCPCRFITQPHRAPQGLPRVAPFSALPSIRREMPFALVGRHENAGEGREEGVLGPRLARALWGQQLPCSLLNMHKEIKVQKAPLSSVRSKQELKKEVSDGGDVHCLA